jgi:hypothetical protein
MKSLQCIVVILLVLAGLLPLAAQERRGKDKEEKVKIITDPELMDLHLDFIKKTEKLAGKYEKEKSWSKAKDCYDQILKLAPQYPPAKAKVEQLLQMEAQAQSQTIVLSAAEKWKDTGITLLEDRPVTIRANGTWTFRLTGEVGPAGLKIPEDLREFDPGCLVGMIVPPEVNDPKKDLKPFMIGSEKQFLAPKTGRLFVQMYDNDVRDNEGELTIEIRGTFQTEEFKPSKKKDK